MANRRRKSNKANKGSSQRTQTLVSVPRGPRMPSSAKRIERIQARYSGANFTLATGAGYSYMSFTSARFSEASPWTQLAALYAFVRPICLKLTVTSARSTGTADNPVVCFAATPDGQPVGSASLSLNTFETPNGVTKTLGPGIPVSGVFDAYIAVAAYSTPSNGYIPMRCPRISLNSLPVVYYGDILLLTPGVTITTTANYVQIKAEYIMEFDTLDSSNTQ